MNVEIEEPLTGRVLTRPAPPDPDIAEAAFQQLIIDLAEICGWWTWHDRDSRGNAAGLPDLLLFKAGRPVHLFELKTMTGRLSPAQRELGSVLEQISGIVYRVMRPSDWAEIVAVLTSAEG